MSEASTITIESTLQETRVFPPVPEFAEQAHVKSFEEYEQIYKKAAEDPEAFWASVAESIYSVEYCLHRQFMSKQ